MDASDVKLRRRLGLGLLTLYGLGTMVGGGFYALLGQVAGRAGGAAPLAFLVAAAIAALSAASFAELSARFPSSAGEARYVEEAFGRRGLALFVGALVIATGVVSAATLARAMAGFLADLAPLPIPAGVLLSALGLGAVAAWGIAQSAWLAAAITGVEVGALVVVFVLRAEHLGELPERWGELVRPAEGGAGALLGGAFLAFYAFIGFEDLVNLAEEAERPRRDLPRAILLSLVVTTVLYVAVGALAVLALPTEELAASRTPLALLVGREGGAARVAMTLVSLFAGANGALVQIVMAARVAYGLGRRRAQRGGRGARLGGWIAAVHARTRTPLRATALATAAVVALALGFPLAGLASATSAILLAVFALVNLALVVVRRRAGPPPEGVLRLPIAVPVLGCLASAGFVLAELARVV